MSTRPSRPFPNVQCIESIKIVLLYISRSCNHIIAKVGESGVSVLPQDTTARDKNNATEGMRVSAMLTHVVSVLRRVLERLRELHRVRSDNTYH